jgi:hypothetical protein
LFIGFAYNRPGNVPRIGFNNNHFYPPFLSLLIFRADIVIWLVHSFLEN